MYVIVLVNTATQWLLSKTASQLHQVPQNYNKRQIGRIRYRQVKINTPFSVVISQSNA
jgi:hypothetical protein